MGESITILGIETSCDETAVAVIRATPNSGGDMLVSDILANQILSQIDMHAPYGGVVPELAARAHILHLDGLVASTLKAANVSLTDMDAIAATAGPGLIGGVLIGLTMGKALALSAARPFIGINHLEAHALSVRLSHATPFPYLLLLVSGGHCQILAVEGLGVVKHYGTTRDDAVGEAFDKAAKLLGLRYPGGPEIERHATNYVANYATKHQQEHNGEKSALPRPLPRPMLNTDNCDFSFSGLKTALARRVETLQPLTPAMVDALAHEFQTAVGDCLCNRTANALTRFRADYAPSDKTPLALPLVMAGGVAANHYLRARLGALAAAHDFELIVPPPALCTDNAAMIAWAGAERFYAQNMPETGMGVPARARWHL